MYSILIENKKIHIHYNDLYEIYNFGTSFLGPHYYTLSLFVLCLGVKKKIVKEIMHFYCMTYMTTPQHIKTPAPGVMKFTILVDPSLVIITKYLVCLINAWEQRRRLFKKYINFTLFTQKLPSLWVMKFTISYLLTLKMLHTKG